MRFAARGVDRVAVGRVWRAGSTIFANPDQIAMLKSFLGLERRVGVGINVFDFLILGEGRVSGKFGFYIFIG